MVRSLYIYEDYEFVWFRTCEDRCESIQWRVRTHLWGTSTTSIGQLDNSHWVSVCRFQFVGFSLSVSVCWIQFVGLLVSICWFQIVGFSLLVSVCVFQFVGFSLLDSVCWFVGFNLLVSDCWF